jgi:hypothetical protein
MTSRLALTLGLTVAACSEATLGGGGEIDAAVAGDGRVSDALGAADAPVDARPCTGGSQAQVAPDGSCFVLITTPMTYVDAQAACATVGGHLAYLKTAALDTFGETFIGAVDTWIGGSDLVTETAFAWDDATPFSFTNWHTGEPNGGGGGYEEDCVIIAGSRVGKQWDDRPCDDSVITTSGKFAALCQY